MFKVGLDSPSQVAKDEIKKKKKSHPQPVEEDVQKLMDELRRSSTETTQEKPPVDKEARKAAKIARRAAWKAQKHAEKEQLEPKELLQNDSKDKRSGNEGRHHDDGNTMKSPSNSTAIKRASNESSGPPKKKSTPLQLKMQQKLSGSRFRWINEQLYTTPSKDAFEIFQTQPQVFKEYHDGFRHQVESWPENPVDSFAQQFKDRLAKPVNAPGGLPGNKKPGQSSEIVVADMGCGEADLALQLSRIDNRKVEFTVHSFDMHKANDRITVADIANVPLQSETCHVVVYCLALMGTNLADFINEGIRVLKPHGLVWIAEIKSRFEKNDYTEFVDVLKNMGSYHKTTDDSNKMFVKFEFVKLPHKLAKAKETHPKSQSKPCIYKRR